MTLEKSMGNGALKVIISSVVCGGKLRKAHVARVGAGECDKDGSDFHRADRSGSCIRYTSGESESNVVSCSVEQLPID
jgi:hypothetical protein